MNDKERHDENKDEIKILSTDAKGEQKVGNECNPNSGKVAVTSDKNQKGGKKVYTANLENLNKKTKRDVLFKHLHTVLSPEEIIQVFVRRDQGFIKLTSKEAFEKALKLDRTELDGGRIRVRDPNKEERESEEESDFDEPPIKKQKITEEEEEGIVYEKILSDSDDSDSDEDESENEDANKIQKLILKRQKKKKGNLQMERQIVKRYAAFIGNLEYTTTDNQVRTFIESIVAPEDIKRFFRARCKDKARGFGFVELATQEALERVLKLDGSKLMGRHVRIGIDEKHKKDKSDNSPATKKFEGGTTQAKKKLKESKTKTKNKLEGIKTQGKKKLKKLVKS